MFAPDLLRFFKALIDSVIFFGWDLSFSKKSFWEICSPPSTAVVVVLKAHKKVDEGKMSEQYSNNSILVNPKP